MKIAIESKFCQNLSKLQDKIEEARRENEGSGGNSQPLRYIFSLMKRYNGCRINVIRRRTLLTHKQSIPKETVVIFGSRLSGIRTISGKNVNFDKHKGRIYDFYLRVSRDTKWSKKDF